MKSLSKIVPDQSDFSNLRENGAIYIDKTEQNHAILTSETIYFFCARPRRMGKSLFLSVMENIYLGKNNLFNGTWIEKADCPTFKDDGQYPVIRFVPPSITDAKLDLRLCLNQVLSSEAKRHGLIIKVDKETAPSANFEQLIEYVSEKEGNKKDKGKVVVLVDEYDRPIMDTVKRIKNDNFEEVKYATDVMHTVYQVLKDKEPKLKKCLIVGSAKFSRLSVLSGILLFFIIAS